MPIFGTRGGFKSITYRGPGDLVAGAHGFWGLRAYSAGTIGIPIVRIRRSGDLAEQDFAANSAGRLDKAAIAAFKGGALLFVKTLYDQIGSTHYTQTTNANQPFFNLDTSGLFEQFSTFEFESSSSRRLVATAAETFSQPQSLFSTFFPRSTADAALWGNGTWFISSEHLGANNVNISAGTLGSAACLVNTWHALSIVVNGAASDINVDGVSNTVDAGANNVSAATANIGANAGANFCNHTVAEFGRWPGMFSSQQKTALANYARTFWGF